MFRQTDNSIIVAFDLSKVCWLPDTNSTALLCRICCLLAVCGRRLDLSRNNLNRLKGLQGCSQVTFSSSGYTATLDSSWTTHLATNGLDTHAAQLLIAYSTRLARRCACRWEGRITSQNQGCSDEFQSIAAQNSHYIFYITHY